MISASRRTEELLEELKSSNAELGKRSIELEEKASLLEVRNREIAEASANLEEKAEQLALVSKYKSEFLANMSHELRTPLNSISILSNLLAENAEANLTENQVEYARTIQSSGRDLLTLINQILDLSKIESGRVEVHRERVPLEDVVEHAERTFRPVARQKNIELEVTIAPDAPVAIATDPQRLQQILTNLLSNAFKFTESGSVKMRIGLTKDLGHIHGRALRAASEVLAFSITDSGIGIPPEKQQLIFEAFQQVDASTARVYGGTGLGLTISRELARLLGGEIHLVSAPGEGSTFTLYLPGRAVEERQRNGEPNERGRAITLVGARQPQPEPSRVASESTSASALGGKRILVVDDDVRNLFAVASLLERYGIEVLPASSADEAFEILDRETDVALVLMDMMMPEQDGYEATRRLRANPSLQHLPVIALTAKAMPGDREKALAAGCNDFVLKPVERDELIGALRAWLDQPVSATTSAS
jgi:signal transduction histidine kinase/ActR/RegA family two-component response regulator